MKAQKVVTIEGTFPELASGKMYQTGRGTGGSMKSAFAAAARDLFKQPALRAKRITMFKATVSVGTRAVENSLDKTPAAG
jgi:hypothetical protein